MQCYQKRFGASMTLLLNKKCIKLEEINHILKIPVERQLKTTKFFLNNHHKLNLLPLGKETFPKPSAIKMKV